LEKRKVQTHSFLFLSFDVTGAGLARAFFKVGCVLCVLEGQLALERIHQIHSFLVLHLNCLESSHSLGWLTLLSGASLSTVRYSLLGSYPLAASGWQAALDLSSFTSLT
jgi:hypothetical protein